jgi:RNA polymerase sigma factor (TIGR02999 family)
MSRSELPEVTKLLRDWNDGDEVAKERVLPIVYDELKRQARSLMSRERSDHTLQPTALVHEAFIKLSKQSGVEWQNRGHFYAIAAKLMRQILVDHARLHAAEKRGSNPVHVAMDDLQVSSGGDSDSLVLILAVDTALSRLGSIDERQATIVEMRFFGGMTNSEIADVLQIGESTVGREWHAAKLWLYRELSEI